MSTAEVNWESFQVATLGAKGYRYSHSLWEDLPQNEEFSYISCKRVFERFPNHKAFQLLGDLERALAPDGLLELYITDSKEVSRLIMLSDEKRGNIFGQNWKNESCHLTDYDESSLKKLLNDYGFDVESVLQDASQEYPCTAYRLRKRPLKASWQYLDHSLFPGNPDGLKILDIGPGNNPYPHATAFFDITYHQYREKFNRIGKPMHQGDIQKRTTFKDKEFDFVLCSHVMEHLENPVAAAAEISRVAKSGLMILPSIFKEFLFGWEERDHLWWPLPPRQGQSNTIRLMKPNLEYQQRLMDADFSSTMCAQFRAGNMAITNNRKLRHWFRKNEANLDVVVPWSDELKVEIYE